MTVDDVTFRNIGPARIKGNGLVVALLPPGNLFSRV